MAGLTIRADDLRVEFPGCTAVDGVSLSIEPGERVALVGPSGSGKTTLLRTLCGGMRATHGTVEVDGDRLDRIDAGQMREVRSRIGFVHQDLALVPNVRAVQNVISGRLGARSLLGSLRDFCFPSRDTLARAHALLDRVGIGDKAFVRTDRLSGGQRQRVAIARALFQGPAALFADEPVSSVDPSRARDTVELLARISADDDITLCTSLHNVELAREFFPRLIGLRHGRIVFDERAEAVRDEAVARLYDLANDEMLADGA